MRLPNHFIISNLVYALLLAVWPVSAKFGLPGWIGFLNIGAGSLLPAPEPNAGSTEPAPVPFNPRPPRIPTIQNYCGLIMPAVLDLDTEDTGLIEISQRRSSRIRRQVGKTIEIVDKNSTNPLHDAFRNLVPEDLLDALFDSVTNVSLNRLPAEDRYTWVNGLRGVLTVPKKGKHKKKGYFEVGTGENRQRFGIDEEVSWEVRWDTDDKNENPADDKGPHVNADFSVKKKNGARVKFDIRLNPTRFSRRVSSPNGDATPSSDGGDPNEPYAETIRREGKEFMKKLRDGINFAIGYNGEFAGNRRLSAAEEAAREDIMKQLRDNLVNRWRPIVNGPCDESNPLY